MEKEKIINKKLACVRDVASVGKHVYPLAPGMSLDRHAGDLGWVDKARHANDSGGHHGQRDFRLDILAVCSLPRLSNGAAASAMRVNMLPALLRWALAALMRGVEARKAPFSEFQAAAEDG